MSGTLAFADERLEADFKRYLFLGQRPFCRGYHCINAGISTVAFAGLLYEWHGGKLLVNKLSVQAAIVILCCTALHFINTQPATFAGIFQPWHVFQRICVCVRCCDIRSTWFMVPNQMALLQPSFTLQSFSTTLLLPCVWHCFGLPLPAGLDALSAAAMLITILINNGTFCAAMANQEDWSILGSAKLIEGWMVGLWGQKGGVGSRSEHHFHAIMCQASLGFMQAGVLCATVLAGFSLEIFRRKRFLAERCCHVPGACQWPLPSRRIMSGIVFDVVLIIVGFSSLFHMYMWYLAIAQM